MRLAVGLSGGADSVACCVRSGGAKQGAWAGAARRSSASRPARRRGRRRPRILPASWRRGSAAVSRSARGHRRSGGADAKSGKPRETIEEAARRLRYAWFRQLMAAGEPSTQSPPRTRSTTRPRRFWPNFCAARGPRVCRAFSPKLESPEGRDLRPLLATTRAEIEAYLRELGQDLARGLARTAT